MQNQSVFCPKCRSLVELRHDGTAQATDDYTSPWVFVDHPGAEQAECAASGRNLTALHLHD